MKYLSRLVMLILFVLFFGFALKNDQIVTLSYFFGYQQSAPLVILLLVFFVVGVVLGALAMTPMLFRHRRDLHKHKKTLAELEQEKLQAQPQAPQPDNIV